MPHQSRVCCLREIGKDGRPGPDGADVVVTALLDEVVAGLAGVVGRIVLVGQVCDVQVGDEDGVQVLGGQLVDEPGEVREAIGVDGEGPVLVLVVDVQIDRVGGNLVRAQTRGDLLHLRAG